MGVLDLSLDAEDLSLELPPRVEGSMLALVLDVAAVHGEAPFVADLLILLTVVLGESPSLGDVDLESIRFLVKLSRS